MEFKDTALTPDTVIWGMSIDGICNPSLLTILSILTGDSK